MSRMTFNHFLTLLSKILDDKKD